MTKPAPLCRYCGKPIPKETEVIHFRGDREPPRTREEAQRLTNRPIISIAYDAYEGVRYVQRISTWDGESYIDDFFCKGEHALRYGYFAVKNDPDLRTQAWVDAVRRQEQG